MCAYGFSTELYFADAPTPVQLGFLTVALAEPIKEDLAWH
jgi:hypothetical protein